MTSSLSLLILGVAPDGVYIDLFLLPRKAVSSYLTFSPLPIKIIGGYFLLHFP